MPGEFFRYYLERGDIRARHVPMLGLAHADAGMPLGTNLRGAAPRCQSSEVNRLPDYRKKFKEES
jgi:hypothetical protein